MDDAVRPSSTIRLQGGLGERSVAWFLVHGDRNVVTGAIVLAVVGVVGALIAADVLAIGPDGNAATLFGSGLTAGVVTLITIALSINQLILARVFGSPDELADRLRGTLELRRTVERHAEAPSSPNDPAAFLSMTGTTLSDRIATLIEAIDRSGWNPPGEVVDAVAEVGAYGRAIADQLEGETGIVDALDVILGTEYAMNLTAMHHLQAVHADSISPEIQTEFDAAIELLESIAVARQFFKTISLQQDFAVLSRVIVYSGMVAVVVVMSLTLIYRTTAVTLPMALLPWVVTFGIGAIVAPLAAFVSYLLRAGSIARRTVSVGPFVPPP